MKHIDIMDTTFRDGLQSVLEGRVLLADFLPAVAAARDAGISHFEFGGGERFFVPFAYLGENAFEGMDAFREAVGADANLQTLSRGVNTVMHDTKSRELVDLYARLFKKHGVTTIRNFDPLNDVANLIDSGRSIVENGLRHEVCVTIMELPFAGSQVHTVAYYESVLRRILDAGIPYDSVCFKDATGTTSPKKVFETVAMAKRLLPEGTQIRLHTHETAGISVAQYLAALEAGVWGIDCAASPVSGGTSQPDILVMMDAAAEKGFDFGFDPKKLLAYERELQRCLSDYVVPEEALRVSPRVRYAPIPGSEMVWAHKTLRENEMEAAFDAVGDAMAEVIEKAGCATSVTPVSQFYFQQALNNVKYGPWEKIAPGYGMLVLGHYGKTPLNPDKAVVEKAASQLKSAPVDIQAIDQADADGKKSVACWKERLELEGLEVSDENIFIAAACDEVGVSFLKGENPVRVCKHSLKSNETSTKGVLSMSGTYTVVVNGETFSVQVAEGTQQIQVVPAAPAAPVAAPAAPVAAAPVAAPVAGEGEEIHSQLPGNVWKIVAEPGQALKEGDKIMIIESMKMEIDIMAPRDCVVKSINVNVNDKIVDGQIVAVIG